MKETNLTASSTVKDTGQLEFSHLVAGKAEWYGHLGKQFGDFLKSSTYIFHAPRYLATGIENIGLYKSIYVNGHADFIFLKISFFLSECVHTRGGGGRGRGRRRFSSRLCTDCGTPGRAPSHRPEFRP